MNKLASKLTASGHQVVVKELTAEKYPGAFGYLRAGFGAIVEALCPSKLSPAPTLAADVSACDTCIIGMMIVYE